MESMWSRGASIRPPPSPATSLVTAARHATTGVLSTFIGLLNALPPGHRAMTLCTYDDREHATG